MTENASALQDRILLVERSLRRARFAAAGAGLVLLALATIQFVPRPAEVLDEVRTRRLVVVDDEGRIRVQIAQDPRNTDRHAHINLLDNQTRAVARLYTDADGGGGVQVLKWDMSVRLIHLRTLTYDGDQREAKPMGE